MHKNVALKHKKLQIKSEAFLIWVEDGARTRDLRNHNPTL